MGEAPPLDELAARKRLVQAKMEIHRAEMALYYHEITAPIQTVRSGITSLASHPLAKVAVIGGIGFLLFSGRLKFLRKTTGFVAPLVSSKLRGFLAKQAWNLVFKGFRLWRSS